MLIDIQELNKGPKKNKKNQWLGLKTRDERSKGNKTMP